MINKTYRIEGMHCGSCALTIEMLLKNQVGVDKVKVDFDKKEALIEYNKSQINFDKLSKLVSEAGYKLRG